MIDPELVRKTVMERDARPFGQRLGEVISLEDAELDTLPIPLPGATVLLEYEEPPPLYLRLYKRALVVVTKVSTTRHRPPTLLERRAMAQIAAEYGLWDLAGRTERRQRDWPKTTAAFIAARGLTEGTFRTALDMTRYKMWISRYQKDRAAEEIRNVDDILYAKCVETADLPAGKGNPKWFETLYRRRGLIAPKEGAKSLTVNLMPTAEEREALYERIQTALPYAKGEHDGVRPGDSPAESPGGARGAAAQVPAGLEEDGPRELRPKA